jgi:membrane protein
MANGASLAKTPWPVELTTEAEARTSTAPEHGSRPGRGVSDHTGAASPMRAPSARAFGMGATADGARFAARHGGKRSRSMRLPPRFDEFQQRHPAVGFPLAVAYKFFDDQGVYLAALMTYYGFLSLFPLLLLLASLLGFALRNDEDLRQEILDSTLSQFPVIGEQLRDPSGLEGSGVAIIVGAIIALYGALGVAQALQHAMNTAWAVPRNRRPNPLKARARSLLILAAAGVAVLATTTLSIFAGTAGAPDGVFSSPIAVLTAGAAAAVNTVIFGAVFRIATARRITFVENAPGAVLAAIVWQVMQVFGTAYVSNVVKDRTATYGVFALVLGLLAWTFLVALGIVISVEVNVVRSRQLYPRSLLTPFTDDVDLTEADQDTYRDAATAQRHKGFERVHVSFDHDGRNATARRRSREANRSDDPDDTVSSP